MTTSKPPAPDFATEGAVVACMATYPGRYATLEPVVAALAPQVDRLFVYANETTDGLPDLSRLANVVVLDGREHAGNLSANGKVYPLRFLKGCLVLTVDDDFLYPPDYVRRIRRVLDAFGNRCCVTIHGSVLPPRLDWYYDRSKVFVSHRRLDGMQLINLAGSGTFAFHQSTLRCTAEDFLPEVMVDLRFSLLARERRLPIWSPPRPEGWLRLIHPEGLWQIMKRSVTHHTLEARRHDWSFAVYREIANDALQAAGLSPDDPDLRLDPELARSLVTGLPPTVWRVSAKNLAARTGHLYLLAEA